MIGDLDFRQAFHLALVGVFYLSILMVFVLFFGDGIQRFFQSLLPRSRSGGLPTRENLPAEQLSRQQEAARRRIQDEHQEKAESYNERVLKPRQEAKKADLEREFYRFAGPAWKGQGHATRSSDDSGDAMSGNPSLRHRRELAGSSRDAATARKLPESVTNPPRPPPAEPKKTKTIITLPEEPEEGTEKSITIALRGMTSQVKKRRFLYTDKIQVVLDWMTKLGYHQTIYTLVTTFPRRDLSQNAQQTLEEFGIDHDIALVVEEIQKDDSS